MTDADWVLATEESGHTRHFGAATLPVVVGGADTADIRLAGVAGTVQFGSLDGVFFAQPGKHTENVRIDGEPLRGSRRIQNGNVIALDSARLKCTLRAGRLTVAIEARVTAGDTAPPDLEEVARSAAAEVAIAPVAFKPAVHTALAQRRRVSNTTIVVSSAFAVLAVLAWFAFTAKSVELIFEPPVDEYALPTTLFKLNIGDRHLLRSGRHKVTAELAGYYPLETRIDVGDTPSQTIRLTLTKLPGLITLTTSPEVGAQVKVDGNLLGTTPLTDVEITPGTHQVEFSGERYLAEVVELVVMAEVNVGVEDGDLDVTFGAQTHGSVTAGKRYIDGTWYSANDHEFAVTTLGPTGGGHTDAHAQLLLPVELHVSFYDLAGPYVSLAPKVEAVYAPNEGVHAAWGVRSLYGGSVNLLGAGRDERLLGFEGTLFEFSCPFGEAVSDCLAGH